MHYKSKSLSEPIAGGNVKVVCRFRPFNRKEIEMGSNCPIKFIDNRTIKIKDNDDQYFSFDAIFDTESTQDQVFEEAGAPLVAQVLQGFNGTIFAYGQTGSGKTFTMQGPSIDDQITKGLIPRIVSQIFQSIDESPDNLEWRLKFSVVEVYMEKIRDLMDLQRDNLKIREKNNDIYIEDVSEHYVTNFEEVQFYLKVANANRSVASTDMNAGSSRSHQLFSLEIGQTDIKTNSAKVGKLYLVDLAGSEKLAKTNAKGTQFDEAKKINLSLSAQGNVINSLTDKGAKHIPYRSSKLTRILQNSLGGNSKTTLIITCSPSDWNQEETVSTLRFGMRAKAIKNNAKINKEYTVPELQKMAEDFQRQIENYKNYVLNLENLLEDNEIQYNKNLQAIEVTPNTSANKSAKDKTPDNSLLLDKKNDSFSKPKNLHRHNLTVPKQTAIDENSDNQDDSREQSMNLLDETQTVKLNNNNELRTDNNTFNKNKKNIEYKSKTTQTFALTESQMYKSKYEIIYEEFSKQCNDYDILIKENHILNLQIDNFNMKNKTMEEKVGAMEKQINLLENINASVTKDLVNLQKTYIESFNNQSDGNVGSKFLLEKKLIENLSVNSLFEVTNRIDLGTQKRLLDFQNSQEISDKDNINFECNSCRTHHMYLDEQKLKQFDQTINTFFDNLKKERNTFQGDYEKIKGKISDIKVTKSTAELIFEHQDIISKLIMVIQNNMESYVSKVPLVLQNIIEKGKAEMNTEKNNETANQSYEFNQDNTQSNFDHSLSKNNTFKTQENIVVNNNRVIRLEQNLSDTLKLVNSYKEKCNLLSKLLEENPEKLPQAYLQKLSDIPSIHVNPNKDPNPASKTDLNHKLMMINNQEKNEFLVEYFNANTRIVKHIKGGNSQQKKRQVEWLKKQKNSKPSN